MENFENTKSWSRSFQQKNIRITFLEETPKGEVKHKIIIPKGTNAYEDFVKLFLENELFLKGIIRRLNEKYYFKSNKNNKHIYKPFKK